MYLKPRYKAILTTILAAITIVALLQLLIRLGNVTLPEWLGAITLYIYFIIILPIIAVTKNSTVASIIAVIIFWGALGFACAIIYEKMANHKKLVRWLAALLPIIVEIIIVILYIMHLGGLTSILS